MRVLGSLRIQKLELEGTPVTGRSDHTRALMADDGSGRCLWLSPASAPSLPLSVSAFSPVGRGW